MSPQLIYIPFGNTEFTGHVKVKNVSFTLDEFLQALQGGSAASADLKWKSTETYELNQFVSYNGSLYVSKVDNNINNIPNAIDSAFWDLYSGFNEDNFNLSNLKDTDITDIEDGQYLVYDDVEGKWKNITINFVENINDLEDVTISELENGQILSYDSVTGKWTNITIPAIHTQLSELDDVEIAEPKTNQIIRYDQVLNKWINEDPVLPKPTSNDVDKVPVVKLNDITQDVYITYETVNTGDTTIKLAISQSELNEEDNTIVVRNVVTDDNGIASWSGPQKTVFYKFDAPEDLDSVIFNLTLNSETNEISDSSKSGCQIINDSLVQITEVAEDIYLDFNIENTGSINVMLNDTFDYESFTCQIKFKIVNDDQPLVCFGSKYLLLTNGLLDIDTNEYVVEITDEITKSQWNKITFIKNNGSLYLFINDVLKNEIQDENLNIMNIFEEGYLIIGSTPTNNLNFVGQLKELIIKNISEL